MSHENHVDFERRGRGGTHTYTWGEVFAGAGEVFAGEGEGVRGVDGNGVRVRVAGRGGGLYVYLVEACGLRYLDDDDAGGLVGFVATL